LLLAAIGIYGVSAYAVEQRAREFGIRRALGATPLQLRGLVLRQGAVVTAVGLMLGIIGALAITRVLSSLLYDVAPRDPLVFVSAAAVLAVVALAAAWLPAGRALRQEINAVLRHE
jgi:putative ABC transport system permease protein